MSNDIYFTMSPLLHKPLHKCSNLVKCAILTNTESIKVCGGKNSSSHAIHKGACDGGDCILPPTCNPYRRMGCSTLLHVIHKGTWGNLWGILPPTWGDRMYHNTSTSCNNTKDYQTPHEGTCGDGVLNYQ